MDELEAAARALFLARSPHSDWDSLDGGTKDVFRMRAKSDMMEAAALAPPPIAAAPVAPAVELVAEPAEEDAPKPKKGKSK